RYDRERLVGRNNLAPRLGFSLLPRGTSRSKISGGIGLFYDNVTFLNIELTGLQRRFTTAYDDGVPISAAVPSSVHVSPYLHNPYGLHWNVAWENEWAPRWVSRIEYIQKNGHDQTRLAAVDTPEGFDILSIIRGHPIIRRSSSPSIVRFEQIFESLPRTSIRTPKHARPYPWIFRILQSNSYRKRRSNGTRRTDSSRGDIFHCRRISTPHFRSRRDRVFRSQPSMI